MKTVNPHIQEAQLTQVRKSRGVGEQHQGTPGKEENKPIFEEKRYKCSLFLIGKNTSQKTVAQ